jgi:DNA-binding PadR family transcriptional regulator
MISKELLKGTLQTIILRLLEEKGRMYGYEITQHVRSLSDGKLILTEGALYPTLHKLESQGLVRTKKEFLGKRARKYYSLTPAGNKAVTSKLEEFQEFVLAMQLILFPKQAH